MLRKHLAKKGFDPLMGARPMSRLIQETIRKALADELLFGKLVTGGKVTVDLEEGHETAGMEAKVKLTILEGEAPKSDGKPADETVEVL